MILLPPIPPLFPYTTLFRSVLARSVVEAAKADCSFELPQAPEGQTIARSTINVEYRPGDGAKAQRFEQVPDAGHCDPDRKSTRLNSSHPSISYAVFCLKKKK